MGEMAKNGAQSKRKIIGERSEPSETTSRLASLADFFLFANANFFLLFLTMRSLVPGCHNLNRFNKIIYFFADIVLQTYFLNRTVRMTTQSLVEHF